MWNLLTNYCMVKSRCPYTSSTPLNGPWYTIPCALIPLKFTFIWSKWNNKPWAYTLIHPRGLQGTFNHKIQPSWYHSLVIIPMVLKTIHHYHYFDFINLFQPYQIHKWKRGSKEIVHKPNNSCAHRNSKIHLYE